MESLYGNTRSEALEFIEGQLKSDEYHEDLSDTQVSQVLREIQTVNNDQTGKEKTMSSKKTKRIEAGRKAAEGKKAPTAESKAESKAEKAQEKEDKALKIARKDAVKLLEALGFKTAHKASNDLLRIRLGKLQTYLDNYEGTLTGDLDETKDKVLKAGTDGVVITGEEPKGADKAEKKDKPAGKGVKASGKGGEKKSSGPRKVGVIATIIECLQQKHTSKEDILKVLVKRFPDRPEAGMKSTISSQVPSGLWVEKKITVDKDKEGLYFIKTK